MLMLCFQQLDHMPASCWLVIFTWNQISVYTETDKTYIDVLMDKVWYLDFNSTYNFYYCFFYCFFIYIYSFHRLIHLSEFVKL